MAVPRLTGERGICPALEEVVGIVDGPQRWQDFLQAGSRTAQEFRRAWGHLRIEVGGLSAMLGKDLGGPLAKVCESSGIEGSTSRKEITTLREDLRHQAIEWCLKKHPNRLARPVSVIPRSKRFLALAQDCQPRCLLRPLPPACACIHLRLWTVDWSASRWGGGGPSSTPTVTALIAVEISLETSGKYQNCHLVLKGSFWFFLVFFWFFLVLFLVL